MAYTPSKEDFEEISKNKGGYIPSLEDFEEKPKQPKSLKEFADEQLSAAEKIPTALTDIGSSAAQHLYNTAEGIANLPNLLSRGRIPKVAEGFTVPLYHPDSPASQLTENLLTGAEYAPLGAGLLSAAKEIPAVARLGEKLSAPSSIEKGTDLINNLLGGSDISEAHRPILAELRNNYSENVANSNKLYGNVKKLANEEGYSGQDKLSKALGVKSGKSINAESALDKIEKLDVRDNALKNLIEKFKDKPSFDNAHNLQSKLGSEGQYLKTSSDGLQRSLGNEYLDTRRHLIEDIMKSFDKNKDYDLANAYKKATANHKQTVIPYQIGRTINQIVRKKDIDEVNPENIHNVLSKDNKAVEKVVNELSPESKNLILAKKLTPAIEQTETSGMHINPKKLLEQISDIKNSRFNKFLTPEHRNASRDLENKIKFEQRYVEPSKEILRKYGPLGATALGLGGAYKVGKDYF